MTDEQDGKKVTKLTLGGSKLSLNNYTKKVTQKIGGSGPVVVEVKQGRAGTSGLSLNKTGLNKLSLNNDQDVRRKQALEKARLNQTAEQKVEINSLARLAEINQEKNVNDKSNSDKESGENAKYEAIDKSPSARKDFAKKTQPKTQPEKEIKTSKNIKEEENENSAKVKIFEQKKLKKIDIINMLDQDSDTARIKTRSLASLKRAREKERRRNSNDKIKAEKIYREVILPEVITVLELASQMSERASDVTKELMKMGVMATSTQSIDADTAEIVATNLGHKVKRVKESNIEDNLTDQNIDPTLLKARAPIVTVMGHVDHGKTSLLDALKSTDIAGGEHGGITQHIGAYTVHLSGKQMITFIDTPGHEAFTAMRTRGAQITDIVVLVVAADDGIKAQTIEAISHAKAAQVPIIVAINKIDKPEANLEKVKNSLLSYELIPEELGGDIITIGVSAKERKNLDKLEEAILLVAEMQELKANPDEVASGVVIESRIDAGKGVVATVIIRNGTLHQGDILIAGTAQGRIRKMSDDKGRSVSQAPPSTAVEIQGLNKAPSAGDIFNIVKTDKKARDIIDYRSKKDRTQRVTASKTSLEELFLKASGENKVKYLPIIVKGDAHGSVEAIISSLNKINSDEVKLKILHQGVGAIIESDVTLAAASQAIIIGFNVRANNAASSLATDSETDIRYYSIIYNLIDDITQIISGMLSPIRREIYIGSVEIREIFNISKTGKIAGSYVTKGIIKRGAGVRLLRDNIVIHEGKLKTLKRFKEDVKEVRENYECGIAFENYDDIKIGDLVEVFEIVEERKKL